MRTLYGQLMAVTSLVLVVAVGISLWVLYAYGLATANSRVRSALRTDIRLAAAAVQASGGGAGLVAAPMRRRERQLGGSLEIADRSGDVLSQYPTRLAGAVARRAITARHPSEPQAVPGGYVAAAPVALAHLRPVYVVWRVPVRPPPFPSPQETGVLVSGGAAIVLAQLLWALVARRLTEPVNRLTALLDRYGQGDFAARAEIRGPAEFVHLGDAMTRMAEALRTERQAREAFLAEVAHDLRTPLTAMRTLLGSLGAHAGSADPKLLRSRLALAQREAERLSRLVNDLLDLARSETGHLSVSPRTVDLREVAVLGAVSGEAAAQARGIRFSVDLPDAAVWVTADLDRGAQVLVNLVDNAVRYTPEGGSVRVTAGKDAEAGFLRVEDTGPGFEPGAAEWAWSAFTRGKAAREDDGGTGLGLAVGRALTRLMGGDLRILPSGEGLGGRVEMRLPAAAPPHGPLSPAAPG